MLFWHIGASVAFIRYAFRDPMMDLRFLAAGAVLSDVADLPIGIFLWPTFETARLVGLAVSHGFTAIDQVFKTHKFTAKVWLVKWPLKHRFIQFL